MGKYNCEVCKRKCKKEAIRLQDKYFHLNCFTCAECKKQLSMNGFYTRNNLHYCPEDYQQLFSVKCDGCGELAEGEVMTVLGKSFHHHCFKCSKCSKQFEVGEKVTFSKNKSMCQACCIEDKHETPLTSTPLKTPPPLSKSPITSHANSTILNSSLSNGDVQKSFSNGEVQLVNGDVSMVNGRALSVADPNFMKSKSSRSLPRVFGIPDSRFYNICYLDRANNNIRRGVAITQQHPLPPPLPTTHFHRPDNFSYNKLRKDFLPERFKRQERRARRSETHNVLLPIEREDWPGPPDPAAAYPELLREKDFKKLSSGKLNEVEVEKSKVVQQLTQISKSSGTAAELLKEFEKRRGKEDSPNLDPRNASRTPSAAVEPRHNPRYQTPYYASPSRYLDMLPQRSKSTDNHLRKARDEDIVRPYTSLALRGGTLNTWRVGSSMDARQHSFIASEGTDDEEGGCHSRPLSAVDSYVQDRLSSLRYGDSYPESGYRLKASTLPHGLVGLSNFSKLATNAFNEVQPTKKYTYEELLEQKALPGVDRNAVEKHLIEDDFVRVFQMEQRDFQHLPVWQRNEMKIKAGLVVVGGGGK